MPKRSQEWRPTWSLNTVINSLKYLVLGFVLVLLTVLTSVYTYTRVSTPARVQAATSSTLNFQARLLSSAGNVVPDGYYNIQFNIYNVSSGGSTLWTETRDYDGTDDRVRVVNGYFSVNLGSVNSLPALNWDQEHWLGMTIRGSGTCAFATTCTPADSEMTPRLKMTAVPYAFTAGQIAKSSGANRGTLGFNTVANNPVIQLPDIAGTNNAVLQSGTTLLTQGSIPFLDATGRLTQDNANLFYDDTGNRLGIGTATPTQGRLVVNNSTSEAGIYIGSNVSETQPGIRSIGYSSDGVNGGGGLEIGDGSGVFTRLFRDSSNNFHLNVSAGGSPSNFTFLGASGSGSFIFESGAAASAPIISRGYASQTGDLLQLQTNGGTILTAFQSDGKLVFGPSGAQDTNLYRPAANTLKTDDTFEAASGFRLINLTRTVPTTVNDAVDIGSFGGGFGGNIFDVSVVVSDAGFSLAKSYRIATQYDFGSTWHTALPLTETGAWGGENIAIDVRQTTGTTEFRLRRTAGSTAGTARITIRQEGTNVDAFTASTATSSVAAPTTIFYSTPISQQGPTGAVVIRNNTNSASAFQIQNAAGTGQFTVDTTNGNTALVGDIAVNGGDITSTGVLNLTPGSSSELINVLTGNLKVGNGTPTVSLNGEDAYIEGTLEVDGNVNFAASLQVNTTGAGSWTNLGTSNGTGILGMYNSSNNLVGYFSASGVLSFADGAGGSIDTNIYRNSAGELRTDSRLRVSGDAANVSNGSILVVDGNLTSTTNQQFGIRSAPNIAPGSASTQVYNGIQGVPVTNSANVAGARLVGVSGAPYVYGSSTVGSVVGLYAFNQADNTSTITDSYQILAGNPFKAGGATITNNYGMYVEAQTNGTNNVGIGIGEVTGTAQTNLLIGATQPAGSWSIYNASPDANYFAGNFDTGGTIQAGTGNENLTLTTGKIDADAITLVTSGGTGATASVSGLQVVSDGLALLQGCGEGEILKWDNNTDVRWECAADGTGGSSAWSSLTVPTDNLNLDHAGNTTTFTTDTATGTFFTMIGNSISSGSILQVSSVSTGLTTGSLAHVFASGNPGASWTGSLLRVEYGTSTDADVDGNAVQVGLTGAGAGSGVALNVTTAQTGSGALALRVNDDGTYADTTPFAVTAAGDVGIGTDAPSAKLHVAGDAIFRNGTNSATAIQIQNATAADTLFTVDTTARGASGGNLLKVGNSTGTDGDLTILKLDSATANPTSNLAALNGGLFYNSTTNKVNIIENGAVKTLCNTTDLACGTGGASAIQASYDASTTVTSGIITTAANKNFYIRAGSGFNNTSLLVVQNAASGNLLQVDSTNSGNITLLGNYSGEPSSWSTDTDGSLPTRYHHGSVIANGYMYVVGGRDTLLGSSQSTVYYAKVNADGSVGVWATTSALPAAREQIGGSVVAANGYIYAIGGNNGGAIQSTVYYAKVNSDGTLGSWQTNAFALGCATAGCGSPVVRTHTSATIANGYVYVVGGTSDGGGGGASANTYYAKLNADGSTGAWSTTLTLPAARFGDLSTNNVVTANGYIYYLAGNDTGGAASSKVYYAQLNSNGTLTGTGGNWLTDTDLANANCRGSSVTANGFIYIYNNNNNAVCYLPLNSNGTLGTEVTATTTLPDVRLRGAVATTNGYLYLTGGTDAIATPVNTIYYASLGRVKLGGSLDLVGLSGENLANPGSGGSLTAGNTHIAGSLQVQGQANFAQSVSIDKELVANSSVLFKNAANSTSAFQVQASGSTTPILNVDTTNSRVGIGTATPLFELHMVSTNNFGSLAVGGAFVDQNSYFGDEFMTPSTTADITTDTTGTPASGAYGTGMGDDRRWGVYMDDVSSCTASTIDDSLNGVLRLSLPQADKGCMVMVDEAINNARLFLDADNLPTMLFKVKPSQADATSHINIGMGDATDGALDSTPGNNFLGFTNNGGTSWVGHARSNEASGGTSNTAACATINTSNFALLMVKVISASEVKFYVDTNVSDGVSFTECASITTENNIPDAALAPEIHWHESTGGTASNLEVDFFRVWQDDAPTSGDPDPAPDTELQTDTSNSVAILNNGNYDNLTVTGTTTTKDLAVTGVAKLHTLVVEQSASIGTLVVLGSAVFNDNISVGGHIITAGNAPAGQVLGAVGLNGTVTIDGNDTAGTITIITGQEGMTAGDLTKISFVKAYNKTPKIVLSPHDDNSINARAIAANRTANDFILRTSQILQANTTYTFDYFIVE